MTKRKRTRGQTEWSIKHYTINKRSSKTNSTKNQGELRGPGRVPVPALVVAPVMLL
jgi:hypothetical protein